MLTKGMNFFKRDETNNDEERDAEAGNSDPQPSSGFRQQNMDQPGCGTYCVWLGRDLRHPIAKAVLGGVVLVVIIVVLASSFTKVAPTDTGFTYSTITATLGDDPLEQGLQTKPTFGTTVLWPSKYTSVEFTDTDRVYCNSADGLFLQLDLAFQFVPLKARLRDLTLTYRDFERYQVLVRGQGRSAATHACGDFTADDFQSKRSEVVSRMRQKVIEALSDRYSAEVAEFQLRNIRRPEEYEEVVKEKENARSDIALANSERKQALTKATTKLDVAYLEVEREMDTARAKASVIINQASNYAEGVLGRYAALGAVYRQVQELNGLSTEGIIAYIGNELFADGSSTISVSSPSQLTYELPTSVTL